MQIRPSLVAFVMVVTLAHRASAQAATAASNSLGVWRGRSLCLVKPSSCHDEVAVYRITGVRGSDSIAVDARKIVDGQEEEMGVLACTIAARGASITCAMRNGVWHFTTRGDSLVGELRLPDHTKFRDVRAVRSH